MSGGKDEYGEKPGQTWRALHSPGLAPDDATILVIKKVMKTITHTHTHTHRHTHTHTHFLSLVRHSRRGLLATSSQGPSRPPLEDRDLRHSRKMQNYTTGISLYERFGRSACLGSSWPQFVLQGCFFPFRGRHPGTSPPIGFPMEILLANWAPKCKVTRHCHVNRSSLIARAQHTCRKRYRFATDPGGYLSSSIACANKAQ